MLRLIPIGSTHVGCDDSDGPGHAPRYLDVRRIIAMKYGLITVIIAIIVTVGYVSNFVTKQMIEYDLVRNGSWIGACKVNGVLPYYVTIYEYCYVDGHSDGTLTIDSFLSFFGILYDEGRVRRKYDSATIDTDKSLWEKVDSLY